MDEHLTPEQRAQLPGDVVSPALERFSCVKEAEITKINLLSGKVSLKYIDSPIFRIGKQSLELPTEEIGVYTSCGFNTSQQEDGLQSRSGIKDEVFSFDRVEDQEDQEDTKLHRVLSLAHGEHVLVYIAVTESMLSLFVLAPMSAARPPRAGLYDAVVFQPSNRKSLLYDGTMNEDYFAPSTDYESELLEDHESAGVDGTKDGYVYTNSQTSSLLTTVRSDDDEPSSIIYSIGKVRLPHTEPYTLWTDYKKMFFPRLFYVAFPDADAEDGLIVLPYMLISRPDNSVAARSAFAPRTDLGSKVEFLSTDASIVYSCSLEMDGSVYFSRHEPNQIGYAASSASSQFQHIYDNNILMYYKNPPYFWFNPPVVRSAEAAEHQFEVYFETPHFLPQFEPTSENICVATEYLGTKAQEKMIFRDNVAAELYDSESDDEKISEPVVLLEHLDSDNAEDVTLLPEQTFRQTQRDVNIDQETDEESSEGVMYGTYLVPNDVTGTCSDESDCGGPSISHLPTDSTGYDFQQQRQLYKTGNELTSERAVIAEDSDFLLEYESGVDSTTTNINEALDSKTWYIPLYTHILHSCYLGHCHRTYRTRTEDVDFRMSSLEEHDVRFGRCLLNGEELFVNRVAEVRTYLHTQESIDYNPSCDVARVPDLWRREDSIQKSHLLGTSVGALFYFNSKSKVLIFARSDDAQAIVCGGTKRYRIECPSLDYTEEEEGDYDCADPVHPGDYDRDIEIVLRVRDLEFVLERSREFVNAPNGVPVSCSQFVEDGTRFKAPQFYTIGWTDLFGFRQNRFDAMQMVQQVKMNMSGSIIYLSYLARDLNTSEVTLIRRLFTVNETKIREIESSRILELVDHLDAENLTL